MSDTRYNARPASMLASLVLSSAIGWSSTAWSADLNLSNIPLFLGGAIEPNIVFNFDDSGSMYWSYMPDSIKSEQNNRRGLAANWNKVAYNPALTYTPPVDASGNPYANQSFTSAMNDGYYNAVSPIPSSYNCTINLATSYRPTWHYGNNCNSSYDTTGDDGEYHSFGSSPQRAYYYVFYTEPNKGSGSRPSGCGSSTSFSDDDCYEKVVVNSAEEQNFANWYSYYRKRTFTAKNAVGKAFARQGTDIRVGYAAINNSSSNIDGVNTSVVTRGVRPFTGTDRTEWFELLYKESADGSTPLRAAADRVGEYFLRSDSKGPWSTTPGSTGGADHACRQSYHIMMSDGYWNSTAANGGAANNNDGTSGPSHTSPSDPIPPSFSYSAVSPYSDSRSGTLADVAMYYWKNDLRTDLENTVPVNSLDPAFWQHLVTFSIGLGLSGSIDPDTAFAAIDTGATINWPNPSDSQDLDRVDDMLHAAVNSRGGFFTTDDPDAFADALAATLRDIDSRTSSSAAVALNSSSFSTNSKVYQVKFESGTWSGELLAFDIALTSYGVSLSEASPHNTAEEMPTHNNRRILSYNGTSGHPFQWSDLSNAQKAALDTASASLSTSPILSYLRGDRSLEGTTYRTRAIVDPSKPSIAPLGDIIASAPSYIGPPSLPYPESFGSSAPEAGKPYSAFRVAQANRDEMIAVGGNDGMLHFFDAETLVEEFAFVPGIFLRTGTANDSSPLRDLTQKGYVHRYYFDGSPTVLDAFFDGAWHTVLVSGLAGGGQSIVALDLTSAPTASDTESTLATKVLWEITDATTGFADLGYTYSRPNIVRLANGKWAAVFGNGYNNTEDDTATGGVQSSTGNAVLYIVDLEDGSLIKTLDTGEGSADDPLGLNRPNGLSTVTPVDRDGDFVIDLIYAGDYFGNLWKFDVSSLSTSQWSIAGGSTPTPLFRARQTPGSEPNATAQPITVRPQVVRHPAGSGHLVLFGTGKYIEIGDHSKTGQTTQTFYAIWDRDEISHSSITRNHLLEQEIFAEVDQSNDGNDDYRASTDRDVTWYSGSGLPPNTNSQLGWYMDLYSTEGGNTNNYGERQVTDPLVRGDRVIFTTLVPSDDPCDFGGSGWIMELDWTSGARLPVSPFDVNGDGVFNSDDDIDLEGNADPDTGSTDVIPASGRKIEGIPSAPTTLDPDKPGGGYSKILTTSLGEISAVQNRSDYSAPSRNSWRQLFK